MKHLCKTLAMLLLTVLVGLSGLTAYAHDVPDESKKGSVTVDFEYDNKAVAGGRLALYRIAEARHCLLYTSGKKASAPTLEKRHHKYFLRFSYTEEKGLSKTAVKAQTICSVDLAVSYTHLTEGVETECIRVGHMDVRGCIACGRCSELGKCVFDDVVNELASAFKAADGLVIASPVYYASANATLIAVLDRLFYSSHFDKTMKVGASVVCARRGGCSATFDELNKYFTISNMPIASSQYWNSIHGLSLIHI